MPNKLSLSRHLYSFHTILELVFQFPQPGASLGAKHLFCEPWLTMQHGTAE